MKTDCNVSQVEFEGFGSRKLVASFDAEHITSDGGVVLLHKVDRKFGLVRRLAKCFVDHRTPELIEHRVEALLRQRIYGIACGYEDLNDHATLRDDPLLAAVVGKADPLGRDRREEKDKGHPLASSTVEDPRNIDAQITVGAGSGEYWAQAVGEVIANSYQE